MTTLNMSFLTGSQKYVGGAAFQFQTNQDLYAVKYIVFSGKNASGMNSLSTPTEFVNKTVLVGSPECNMLVTGGATNKYALFIDWDATLCAYDYYVVASGLYLDGHQDDFQTIPYTIYLTPSPVDLLHNNVLITRALGNEYATTITVLFDQDACIVNDYNEPSGLVADSYKYVVAIQYENGNGELQFETVDTTYQQNLKGTQGGVVAHITGDTSGVSDNTYVAIQAVRIITPSLGVQTFSTSEISNTVLALDTSRPGEPTDLKGSYHYNALDASGNPVPFERLTWKAPATSTFIDVTDFIIWRSINSGAQVNIGSVPFTSAYAPYSYNSPVPIPPFVIGDIVKYWVQSNNNVEGFVSDKVGPVTIRVIEPSSAPENLSAVGLYDMTHDDIQVSALFSNPLDVNGDLWNDGYFEAHFETGVYSDIDCLVPLSQIVDTTYVPGQSIAYIANINDFGSQLATTPFTPFKVYVGCRLITYNSYDDAFETNQEIIGELAQVQITISIAPVITDVNGIAYNTNYNTSALANNLNSFNVYTYGILTGTQLVAFDLDDTKVDTFTLATPSYIIKPDDHYGFLPGAYMYHYTAPVPTGNGVAIGIFSANVNGLSSLPITGPVIQPSV